jgi:type II secretory pathway pseudopilin PulG
MKIMGKSIVVMLLLLATAWPIQQQSDQKQDKKKQTQPAQGQQQQQQQQSQQQSNPNNTQPAPLFQGQSNLKSSRQGKDATVLGFNGIGPNGQVEKKMLDSNATADDEQKAAKLGSYVVSSADVNAFAEQGKLKAGK